MRQYFAHSANKTGKRHEVAEHLSSVSRMICDFLADNQLVGEASLAGLLHDFGKYGDLFQARLRGEAKKIDHWSLGAWLALAEYKSVAAAMAIQGHHIGLQYLSKDYLRYLDPDRLSERHPLQLQLSEADLNVLKLRLGSDELQPQMPRHSVFGRSIESGIDRMLDVRIDRKSTRLNSSHTDISRMPSSA